MQINVSAHGDTDAEKKEVGTRKQSYNLTRFVAVWLAGSSPAS
jgi:hypothetical protein